MSAHVDARRALSVAVVSYATLSLVPWAVDVLLNGSGGPRTGLLLAAVPLALVFGALAGYAAAPDRGRTGPVVVPEPADAVPTRPAAVTTPAAVPGGTPRQTRAGPHPALPLAPPRRPAVPPAERPQHHPGPQPAPCTTSHRAP